MKKRKKKKLSQAKLLKKYEARLREIIKKRDKICQIAGLNHACSEMLVADHRPCKRGKHSTFFDPRNLTLVCSTANFLAEHDPLISHDIIAVVRRREGEDVIEALRNESKKIKKWDEETIIAHLEALEKKLCS